MPAFHDLKTALSLSDPRLKPGNFPSYAESVHEYATSDDPAGSAFERAYFADTDFLSGKALLPEAGEPVYGLESDLTPVLARMEADGVWIDAVALGGIADELRTRARQLESGLHDMAGEPFNPNSAKQVQYVLFEKLGIPAGKKIKTGFSVDSDTLEEIGKTHPIATAILEFRTMEKLRATYAEGLRKDIGSDGRIRTTYNQVATATGRLSSESPNLQNIPS